VRGHFTGTGALQLLNEDISDFSRVNGTYYAGLLFVLRGVMHTVYLAGSCRRIMQAFARQSISKSCMVIG
jgi:hypothetical protein